MKRWVEELEHARFDAGRYSQSYQDQLLDLIFANVATVNRPPYCVEFGFNSTSLTEGSGANVAKLVLEHGWQGLLLDGEHDNPAIGLHRHFLLPSNIAEVFRRYGVPQQPEYVSIDVDSIDLWLFEALLPAYPALVFSVEYNANYPLDAAITFPNDAQQHWQRDRGYGASLKALTLLAQRHGYALLWVVPGVDAFFIRNELIDDGSGRICFPFDKWRDCTGIPCHPPLRDPSRLQLFLDYETYLHTGGDLERSRASAYPVCREYLLDPNLLAKASRKARRFAARIRKRF